MELIYSEKIEILQKSSYFSIKKICNIMKHFLFNTTNDKRKKKEDKEKGDDKN